MKRDTREREYVIYNGHLQRVRSTRLCNKPFDGMSTLNKLTSLTYLGFKLRHWLRVDKREDKRATIAMDEDDEAMCRRSMRDTGIITCDELMAIAPAKLTTDRDDRRASITTTRTSDSEECSHFSLSFLTDDSATAYEPTKEQRRCRNCSKCYQRQLSHFELYCGLDCKTAHHVRLSM